MIAAIFDLDGVLVDSHALLCAALDHACRTAGLAPPPHARFLGFMGMPIDRILAELGLPPGLAPEFRAYATREAGRIRCFPQAHALLSSARGAGAQVAILTGKERPRAEFIVANCGLAPLIDLLATPQDAPHKPDPRSIGHVLERLGATRSGSLYVGDSLVDMRTARAAGVRAVFATWGAAGDLPPGAYDVRLDDAADFPELLRVAERAAGDIAPSSS